MHIFSEIKDAKMYFFMLHDEIDHEGEITVEFSGSLC